jgi:hypothetical protein
MSIINQIVKRGKLKKIKKMIDMEALLKAINATTKSAQRHGDELWDLCPDPNHVDGSPSWSININPESDRFGTHNCFSCGYKGNFLTLTAHRLSHSSGKEVTTEQAAEFITNLFSLDGVDEDTIYDLVLEERAELLHPTEEEHKGPKENHLPEEFELIPKDEDNEYYSYLTRPISKGGRGLTDNLLNKYQIGCCDSGLYRKRIIIPFWQEGILISFLARSILPTMKSTKKNGDEFVICPECGKLNSYGYKECIKCDHDLTQYVVKKARARYPKGSTMEFMLWAFDDLDPELDYVILCEGAMDKLRLEKLGYKNVMCVFGNKVSDFQVELLLKFQERINKKLRVFTFPDADEGGDIFIEFANAKLKYQFPTWVVELPWQPDNWLDPGSATPKQIRIAFNKAEKLHKVYARKFGGY